MSITVRIPPGFRALTKDRAEIAADGASLLQLIADMEKKFPGVKAKLFDDSGRKRKFINIYVNSEDVRFLEGENTPLDDGDIVDIVSAIAGG